MSGSVVKFSRLPWSVGPKEIRTLGQNFGKIKQLKMGIYQRIGLSKGFCYIKFADETSASKLLGTSPIQLDGKEVEVTLLQSIPEDYNTMRNSTKELSNRGRMHGVAHKNEQT